MPSLSNYKRLYLVPALLALICFSNTFSYKLVYDDRYQIVEAANVLQDWSAENLKRLFDRDIWAFFSRDLTWEGKNRTPYYRPLFALFVMINFLYAKLDPFGWHLTSVLLHMTASALAFMVIEASLRAGEAKDGPGGRRLLALTASVCFAVHPAQSESVAWVAAYVDALSAVFIFASLLAYLKAREAPATAPKLLWLSAGALFYALGLLTKEPAIVVPVLIAAYESIVLNSRSIRERLKTGLASISPFIVVTVGYLALRVAIFGAIRPNAVSVDFPEMKTITLTANLLTLPAIILKYLQIMIWPFDLNPLYAVKYVAEPNWQNFIAPTLILIAAAAAAAFAAFRSKLARIALIWLVVPLLPALNTLSFKPEDLVHDRYLYLSLLGFGLLIAGAIEWLISKAAESQIPESASKAQRASLIATSALLILIGATAIKQNEVWADEWSLWTASAESVPDSCVANLELGRLSEEDGKVPDAVFYYGRVKSLCPDSVSVYYRLGMLYGKAGDLKRSEEAFLRMAELSPFQIVGAVAHFNLGVVYEKQGDIENAIGHYKKGLTLNPASKNADEVRTIIDQLAAKRAQEK